MLICDTHADTLFAMQEKDAANCDVTLARLTTRPEDIRVQALALFTGSHGLTGPDSDLAQRELAAFEKLKKSGFRQIRTVGEAIPGAANALLTIEGGDIFGPDTSLVAQYASLGVRIAALVWNNENLLAHPAVSGSTQGLKPLGHRMARELRRNRIALDLSHLNERGAWELMENEIPPMASHSCCKALCPHPRNLSDEQLRALFLAGGFVGVNFYPVFLSPEGKASLDTVIDHISHMCGLGGERCVGLGSDFDGIQSYPEGLRHAGQLPALLERMEQRGFSTGLIEAIAGQNFARYLNQIDNSTAPAV